MALAGVLALLASSAAGDDAELRRRIEEQNELIRRQAEQMQEMEDRLRALEDEQRAQPSALPTQTGVVETLPSDQTGHVPGSGFPVDSSKWGSLRMRLYTYARYLNQQLLEKRYTDDFGQTTKIDRRNDFQLNKVTLYSFGWVLDPKFHYLLYVWSANTSQGLGAQVVVAGNLGYRFADYLNVSVGIGSLPGTRSTSGNFPFWLGVDNRLISDEFFRPSYTTGIWANGEIVEGVDYQVMLGNNLSQLGVDAGQLDGGLDTVSAALTWAPLGPYGKAFGDFDYHSDPAIRFGLHYTFSREDAQGQPDTEDFENVQIRLSDGNVIFEPGLFGPGVQIRNANYQMAAFDAGIKYRGLSLEGEYYYRLINRIRGTDVSQLSFDDLQDHGFQLQSSAMLLPEVLQIYLSGSKIFGEYGDPWDARAGVNWFPFRSQSVRWNTEFIYAKDSPVGALSLPYLVGADGPIFYSNLEMFF